MAEFATVVAIKGNGVVYAVDAKGNARALKVGDTLQKGETVRTTGDARVELLMLDGALMAIGPLESVRLDEQVAESEERPAAQESAVTTPAPTIDKILEALEKGSDLSEELDPAAAGLAGATGNDGGHSFVRLLRIVEPLQPLEFEYGFRAPEPGAEIPLAPQSAVDDQPQVTLAATGGVVSDETTDLNVTRTAALVDVGADVGDDATGATVNVQLVIDRTDTGLRTAAGQAVVLVPGADDNAVLGMFDSNADGVLDTVAFTLVISDEGVLAVTQHVALSHGEPGNFDEAVTLDGSVSVRVTAVDGDGDTATQSVAIGDRIAFEDDGPAIDVGLAQGAEPSQLVTQDAQTIGDTSDVATSSGSFAALFTVTASTGADQPATQTSAYALSIGEGKAATGLTSHGQAITLAMDAGDVVGRVADGGGSTDVFRIHVDAGGKVTLTQYAQVDHLPESLDTSNDNALVVLPPGSVVLTASATVTDADQDKASDSQSVDISAAFGFEDDVPSVSIAAVADAQITLGTQDAQTIGAASDTAQASFAAAFLAAVTAGSGGDAPASTTVSGYNFNLLGTDTGLTSHGAAITLTLDSGDVVGRTTVGSTTTDIFRLHVDGTSGQVTLTQYAQVDHLPESLNTSNDNTNEVLPTGLVQLEATATVTDFDNDQVTRAVTVDLGGNVSFDDDVPSIQVGTVADGAITLTTQDAQTIGAASDTAQASFAAAFLAAVTAGSGADTPASTAVSGYHFNLLGTDAGLTSHGAAITLTLDSGDVVGRTMVGSTTTDIFRLHVDGTSGEVTLTQYAQVDHLPESTNTSNDNTNEVLASGLVELAATATVTDYDQDQATSTVTADLGGNVSFDDDVPSIQLAAIADGAITLTTQDAQTIGAASDTAQASFAAAFLAAVTAGPGADAPASTAVDNYHFNLLGTNTGLASNGAAITLALDSGDVIGRATVGSTTTEIFRLHVDGSTGQVTLTQYAQVDHLPESANTSNDNTNVALASGLVELAATATVTDYDNDQVTSAVSADLGGNISFDDDLPSIQVGTVADSGITLTTQDAQTIGAASDTAQASFAAAFLAAVTAGAGADTPASTAVSGFHFNLLGTDTGLTSNGAAIVLSLQSGDVVGRTAVGSTTTDIFRLHVDGNTGEVTLTQYAQVDHLPESLNTSNDNTNEVLGTGLVELAATATVTDYDNDQVTSSVSVDLGGNVSFDDDVPSLQLAAIADGAITLTTQDAQTIGTASDTAQASFAAAFLAAVTAGSGADAPASTAVSGYHFNLLGTNTGLSSNGAAITLTLDSGDVVGRTTVGSTTTDIFRLHVDGSTGEVTLTQYAQVDHLPESLNTSNDNTNEVLASGLVQLAATATVTDFDNDQLTSSVTADLGGNVSFDDDVPSIQLAAIADGGITLTTQDAETIGTASDTAQASFAAAFLAAVTAGSGADAPASTAVTGYHFNLLGTDAGLTSHGAAITLTLDSGDVVGRTTVGSTTTDIFRLHVDGSTGQVTLTQYAQVDHLPESLNTSNDNTNEMLAAGLVQLAATATVTDYDNDQVTSAVSVDLGGNVSFDDDVPSIQLAAIADGGITLTTQDPQTIGAASDMAQASFAAAFLAAVTAAPGADAPASTVVNGYHFNLLGTNTGLTSHGADIVLSLQSGDVIGRTTVGSTTTDIFRLHVDSGTGQVTLTQYAQVDHLPESTNTSNDNTNEVLSAGLVQLAATATVTDYDNDQVTSAVSIDLGGNVSFDDDVPSIQVAAAADAAITLTTQDAQTIGTASDTAQASFAAAFLAAVTAAPGADAPASTVVDGYHFNLLGTNTGLTSHGAAIVLSLQSGDVVGRTTVGSTTTDIFRLHVDGSTGQVTLTQYAQVDHLPESLNTSNDNTNVALANSLVELAATATITDFDNDQVTSGVSVDLGGNVSFDDDVPSIQVAAAADAAVTLTTQDAQTIGTASDTAQASFAAAFLAAVTASSGADAPASTAVSGYHFNLLGSSTGLTSNGAAIVLSLQSGDVVGRTTVGSTTTDIFRLHVDGGTGQVTLTQHAQVDHLPESLNTNNDNTNEVLATGLVELAATATVTDYDNDQVTSAVSVDLGGNVSFDDDVPSVRVGTVDDGAITLTTQDAETIGTASDTAQASFAAAFVAAVTAGSGADAPASTAVGSYHFNLLGTDTGLTSHGAAIVLALDSGDVVGRTTVGSTTTDIFRLHVDGTSGEVTLTQYAQVDHLPESLNTSNDNTNEVLASGLVELAATATVTDYDNDQVTSAVSADLGGNVSFDDDVPSIRVGTVADGGITLTTQDAETIGTNSDTAQASFAAAFLAAVTAGSGADAPASTAVGSYHFNLLGTDTGLTSHGADIVLSLQSGDVVGSTTVGSTTTDIFRLHVDGTSGEVTLTQYAQVDHLPESLDTSNDNTNEVLAAGLVQLAATATVTDYDNDQVTSAVSVDLGGNVSFDDDVPSIQVGTVDDGGITLTTHDPQTIGAASDTAQASFAAAFLAAVTAGSGADTPASAAVSGYHFNLLGTDTDLTSHGADIVLSLQSGDVVGSTTVGSTTTDIFRLHVDGTSGEVTLTQYAQVDHLPESPDTSNDNSNEVLASGLVELAATATITDYDNDQVTSAVSADLGGNVSFDDDLPSIEVGALADGGITLTTQDSETIGAASDTAQASFAAAFLAAVTAASGADTPASTVVDSYHFNLLGTNTGFTSHGAAITLALDSGDVVGRTTVGSTTTDIFRLHVGGTSGEVTLTQYAQVDHLPESLNTSNDNTNEVLPTGLVQLEATATVTDFDNDQVTRAVTVDLGGNVSFDDDVPSVRVGTVADGAITLTTQDAETIGSDSDTAQASFAAAFLAAVTAGSGADAPADTAVSGYHFNLLGTTTGLTSHGAAITLVLDSGDVVGRTTVGSTTTDIFRLHVDGTSGEVTLTQYAQVDHLPESLNTSNDNTNEVLAAGLVELAATATVTDYDNDQVTSAVSVDLGGNVSFDDDVPSLQLAAIADGAITLTTQDAETIGTSSDTAQASFAAAFLAAVTTAAGADTPASTVVDSYHFNLLGTDTGLTSHGADIVLALDSGDVVGRTTVGSTTTDIFRLHVDGTSGEVTLTQYAQVDHLPETLNTTNDNTNEVLASGLVELAATATVTDYDNDQATGSIAVDLGGNVSFDDDIPSVRVGTVDDGEIMLTTQDAETIGSNSDTAQASFAAAFVAAVTAGSGADAPASTAVGSYHFNLLGTDTGLTSHGADIVLALDSGDVVGRTTVGSTTTDIFRLHVDGTSGQVTLTQYAQVDHLPESLNTSNDNTNEVLATRLVELAATATVTDYDNDQVTSAVSADLGGNVSFDDDLPSIRVGTVGDGEITLTTQDAETIGTASDTAQASFAAAFLAAVTAGSGADAPASTAVSGYHFNLLGTDTGLTSHGAAIVLSLQSGDVVGRTTVGSTTTDIFRLHVDGTSGEVTLTQYAQVDHLPESLNTSNDNTNEVLASGLVELAATATVTDYDNDQVTSSVTADLGGNVSFDDDVPSLQLATVADGAITLTTQDSETIGTNSDTAQASFAAAFLAAVTTAAGADTPASTGVSGYHFNLLGTNTGLTSHGAAIVLVLDSGDVIGRTTVGSTTTDIFRLHVDGTSGEVTLTQYAQVDHLPESLNTSNDNTNEVLATGLVELAATATVTDYDNDQATGSIAVDLGGNVSFDDDIPSVRVGTVDDGAITLTTQDAETIGSNSDTAQASFAAAFLAAVTADSGADAPASTVVGNYHFNLLGTDTGLTSHGADIVLALDSGDVVGRTTVGSTTTDIFRLHVDGTSGEVTLTQYAQVDHLPESLNTSNDNTNEVLASGLVELAATATVTDYDNDQVTSAVSADLGGNVSFDDDVPSIRVGTVGDGEITLTTQDAETIGTASDTAQASFAAAFLAAVTAGAGADTPASTVVDSYHFNLLGTDTGLTSHGAAIVLALDSGDVVGSTTVGSTTTDIFRLHVDGTSGQVTLTQYAQVDHLPESLDTSNDNTNEVLATGLVELAATATVTDYDNDQATAGVKVDLGGNVSFDDDVPSLQLATVADGAITLTTQDAETIGAASDTAQASFAAAFLAAVTAAAGADTPASTAVDGYHFNLLGTDTGLTSHGADIVLALDSGDVVGRTTVGSTTTDIFRLHVDGTSGQVTLTQYAQVDHLPESLNTSNDNSNEVLASGLVELAATATVTDYDNDQVTSAVSADLGGNVSFDDDVPSIRVGTVADSGITLTTQDAQTIGAASDTAQASFAAAFLAAVTAGSGADAPASTAVNGYHFNLLGTSTGLTSSGAAITLALDSGDVIGRTTVGSTTTDIFRLHVDGTSGEVTLTQYAQVDHLPESLNTSNDNTNEVLPTGLVELAATATVTDFDNDQVSSSVTADLGGNVSFDDDAPSIQVGTVADSGVTLITQDAQTIGAASDTAQASFAAAFLAAVTAGSGADVPASTAVSNYHFNLLGTDPGLTSHGAAITLTLESGDVIGRTTGGTPADIFRLHVDGTSGQVTLTQYAQVDHLPEDVDATNDNTNEVLATGLVELAATATVTDYDNDQVTSSVAADLGGNIGFDDDIPSVQVGTVADGGITLTTQDAQTIGAASDTAQASFAAAFLAAVTAGAGADAPASTAVGSYHFNLLGTASGLTSNGVAITLGLDSGDVIGRTTVGSTTTDIFRLHVDGTGQVTLTQYAQVDHLPEDVDGVNDNTNVALASGLVELAATATVTDYDNDQVTSAVSADLGGNVSFDDDVPTVIQPMTAHVVNLPGTLGTVAGVPLDTDGNVDNNYGADAPGAVRFLPRSGEAADLTTSSKPIYLYTSADGLTMLGSTQAGSSFAAAWADRSTTGAFVVTLDPAAATDHYDFQLLRQIDGGIGSFSTTTGTWAFTGGNTDYVYYTDTSGRGLPNVLLTPSEGYRLNGNASQIGVSGEGPGLRVGESESIRVDYVTGVQGEPSSTTYVSPSTHTFDEHVFVNGAAVLFSLANAGNRAEVNFRAYDDAQAVDATPGEDDVVGDYEEPAGTCEQITRVTVNGTAYTSDFTGTGGFSVDFMADGSVTVTGVADGDLVAIFTADGFTTAEYHYVGGDPFALAGFGATAFDPGALVTMNFDLGVYDSDGDLAPMPDGLQVMLSPDDHQVAMGTEGADTLSAPPGQAMTLVGLGGGDALSGDTGDDILLGGAGGDLIEGGDGSDLILGGAGNDTLFGGADGLAADLEVDTFAWKLADAGSTATPASDVIRDMRVGTGGDVLDLRDLLQGELAGNDPAAAASLDQYLHFAEVGGRAVLQVDPDAGTFQPTQTITFGNLSLNDLTASLGLPAGAGDLDIIRELLEQGNLKNSA